MGSTFPLGLHEYARKFGGELGFFYGKSFNENICFETGLNIDAYGRRNIKVLNKYNYFASTIDNNSANVDSKSFYEDASYIRFSFQIPLLLSNKFKNNKIETKTGLLFSARNLFTFTRYSRCEPDFINTYSTEDKLGFRSYGIDLNLGFYYKIIKKLRLYVNYRTPINQYLFNYNIISFGLSYNIIN